jgi:hypothetical protein
MMWDDNVFLRMLGIVEELLVAYLNVLSRRCCKRTKQNSLIASVWTVGVPAEIRSLAPPELTPVRMSVTCCVLCPQVLEWDGVPLVDRSFEEVCAVMDRTGDVAELLVEHGTDL